MPRYTEPSLYWVYAYERAAERDNDEWRRESAMQAGMGGGTSAYNEAMEPDDLDANGKRAYEIIVKFLRDHEVTYTGGCKAFRSPAEWAARGETYWSKSCLIVVYDGGAHRSAFTLDEEDYDLCDALQEALREGGFMFEECTTWYGAVYSQERY